MTGLSNNVDDYTKFYHNMNGKKIRHDRVHNLFGYNMTRAAGEAFGASGADKRILMFSRSSYIGMHRYGRYLDGRQQILVVSHSDESADAAVPEYVRDFCIQARIWADLVQILRRTLCCAGWRWEFSHR